MNITAVFGRGRKSPPKVEEKDLIAERVSAKIVMLQERRYELSDLREQGHPVKLSEIWEVERAIRMLEEIENG